jgi:hypothetical protein
MVFDWDKGELAGHDGPDDWQRDILSAIRDRIVTASEAIQIAVASDTGLGRAPSSPG